MEVDINNLFLILNSAVTFFCGGYILYHIYTKKLEKYFFYYTWAAAFLLYGIEIWLKLILKWSTSDYLALLILSTFFFFLISLGLWSLNREKHTLPLLIVMYCLSFSISIGYGLNLISFELGMGIAYLIFYGPSTLLLIHNRLLFGKNVDRLVFGWFLLLVVNIFLFGMGWITDLFASFSKIVLLMGVIDQDFTIISQKVREKTTFRYPSPFIGHEKEGSLVLVCPSHSPRIEWVKRKIMENEGKENQIYIFSFQDVTPHKQLREIKWIKPEKVHILLFSQSSVKAREEFTVFSMGLTEIGAALAGVIKDNFDAEKTCTVIFMDLSLLIHSFGAYPVYNMLLNKMGALREGGVSLFAFLHPETHTDKSVVSLFTSIADEVIKL
jgi:hypothetical protein